MPFNLFLKSLTSISILERVCPACPKMGDAEDDTQKIAAKPILPSFRNKV